MSAGGELTVYVLVFTRERRVLVSIPWVHTADGEVFITEDDGGRSHLHVLGLVVAKLRDHLISDPGFDGNVTHEAAQMLEEDVDGLIGADLFQFLEDERRYGRDHLVIVPHGPLHYHPIHLVGPPERPLAEDFIVTFLPSLHLLVRSSTRRSRGRGWRRSA